MKWLLIRILAVLTIGMLCTLYMLSCTTNTIDMTEDVAVFECDIVKAIIDNDFNRCCHEHDLFCHL